jgi:large subunit ribosomal protein L30
MAKRSGKSKTIRIKLVRSPIGYSERQKRTVKALGLRKMHQTVEQVDTPAVRGMIASITHLLEVEE